MNLVKFKGVALGVWVKDTPPFFCRRKPEVRLDMCYGTSLFVKDGLLPLFINPQRIQKDPAL